MTEWFCCWLNESPSQLCHLLQVLLSFEFSFNANILVLLKPFFSGASLSLVFIFLSDSLQDSVANWKKKKKINLGIRKLIRMCVLFVIFHIIENKATLHVLEHWSQTWISLKMFA